MSPMPSSFSLRTRLASAAVVAVAVASCTIFIEPTVCKPGSTACAGIHDARFCDGVAQAVEGADCAALGIVPSKHFCVVSNSACNAPSYAVTGRDCRVTRYESVRDSAHAECPAGAPMFVNR